jgi:pimeloyl-ACP methyl ester carboxylesterase
MTAVLRRHTLREGTPDGRHVVLIHGLEDSWESWFTLSRALPPTWRITALDLPWRAGSDYAWRTRPNGEWLADALPDRPDVVVAHSFGAHAMLEYAAATPGHGIGTAVLICPLYWSPELHASWPVFDAARNAFEQHIRDGIMARLNHRGRNPPSDVLDSMTERALGRIGPMGLLTVFDRLASSRSLPVADIGMPVLVLAARGDATLPMRAAKHLEQTLPSGQLHISDDFDHFCHIKLADTLARHIRDFDQLAPASAAN